MQVQHVGHRIRGFYRLADYALRWGMIAPDAQRRLQILDFWRRHGLDATREAFQVSRRTLFAWRAKFRTEGGNLAALVPRSTAPKQRRQRQWPPALRAPYTGLTGAGDTGNVAFADFFGNPRGAAKTAVCLPSGRATSA